MGDFPQIDRSHQSNISIPIQSQWKDHHFQGQPVLPAVEAMQFLARRVQHTRPHMTVAQMGAVRFPKFLPIPADTGEINVNYRLDVLDTGGLQAVLETKRTAGAARITRSITHAQLDFDPRLEPPDGIPLDLAATILGRCYRLEPDIIYRDLVPFGPGFRSICKPLVLTAEGALAQVRAPGVGIPSDPLGSPFPLDGAFHAACVWGQRYAGRVAFPVGIHRRFVFHPTANDEIYTVRVVPVEVSSRQLIVDLWLLDTAARVREVALGVDMRDVSHGTWKPPAWIMGDEQVPELHQWGDTCRGAVILERDSMAVFASKGLSAHEAHRLSSMGPKRRNGYICARLACKRLWRRMAGDEGHRPSEAIDTISAEHPEPSLPAIEGQAALHCSVSHDRRFCVAVAGESPLGVDVEPVTPRA
jgi:hypothetical protein